MPPNFRQIQSLFRGRSQIGNVAKITCIIVDPLLMGYCVLLQMRFKNIISLMWYYEMLPFELSSQTGVIGFHSNNQNPIPEIHEMIPKYRTKKHY